MRSVMTGPAPVRSARRSAGKPPAIIQGASSCTCWAAGGLLLLVYLLSFFQGFLKSTSVKPTGGAVGTALGCGVGGSCGGSAGCVAVAGVSSVTGVNAAGGGGTGGVAGGAAGGGGGGGGAWVVGVVAGSDPA